jgi:DNA mismatch repair protein MutL
VFGNRIQEVTLLQAEGTFARGANENTAQAIGHSVLRLLPGLQTRLQSGIIQRPSVFSARTTAMIPRITALPTSVINQIAAGEVIERPSSVVKELLENSVDAGSTRIEIDIEQGGHDLIRMVDDGCGMLPEDLPLAFSPHATSKLREADDLFRIGTFGFRGEALASIGGVAHVLLQSRPPHLDAGAAVECVGSELTPVRPWNGAPGTRIEVRKLFFNTPVRRKFLRSPATEIGHISEAVIRLALANARHEDRAGLHLVLRHNGRVVHDIPASTRLPERIRLFFGEEVSAQLMEIQAEGGPVRLTGYIGDPGCDRGTARMQYLFINGRWVRDRSLGHAIQEAYRGLLMTGRYAVAFLFLELPPDEVDVNVHPTKAEVRFRHAHALHHLLFTSIKSRLAQENLTARLVAPGVATLPALPEPLAMRPDAPSEPRLPFGPSLRVEPPASPAPSSPAPASRPNSATIAPPPASPASPPSREPQADEPRVISPFRIEDIPLEVPNAIQLYDSYLVLETEEGMLVIDQHALHERILYEQYRARLNTGTLESQSLLIPEPVELPGEAAGLLLEQRDALGEFGLGIEPFGGNTVLLTRYPTLLGHRSPSVLLKAVVDHLLSKDRLPPRDTLFNDLLSLMACHSAVRAGERLSPEQIGELAAQRRLAEDHHHCPHGRPTALLFTKHDLERQFRRA